MKKKTNLLLFFIVVSFTFLYAGSTSFQDSGLFWLNRIKNVFLISILILLILRNFNKPIRLPQNVKAFYLIMIPLYIIELCSGKPTDFVTPILGWGYLYIATRYSDKYFIKYLYLSILIITVISCLLLVNIYIMFGFYARDELLFDKSMLTFLFGISYILLLLDLKYSISKYKWLTIILIVFTVIANIFILQSKTSILIFILCATYMSIKSIKRLPYLIIKYSKYLILGIAVLIVVPIEYELPDTIKQAINIIAGKQVYQLSRDIGTDTYDVRAGVMDLTLDVVSDSPIVGIGFGNQEPLLRSNGFDLLQAESQILDMLLDGGVPYLIAFGLFILPMIFYAGHKIIIHRTNFTNDFIFLQSLGFIILCISNEMFTSLGWLFMGTLAYLYITHENVNILGKYWSLNDSLKSI